MSGEAEASDSSEQRARIFVHPARWMIATVLGERPASAVELAQMVELPVEQVRYHLRMMVKRGVIELAERKRTRGTVEQFYRAPEGVIIRQAALSKLTSEEQRRIAANFLKVCFREATRALVATPVPVRDDDQLARVPMIVDEEGWDELALIHRETFERVQRLKVRIEKRVEGSDGEGFRIVSLLMLFQEPSIL